MEFSFFMPTETVVGRGCVRREGRKMAALGRRALIVTGKSSARCGALADITSALGENGQTYAVYDGVRPDPTLACVRKGLALLKESGADFVVGIGGGSPMDAAKAIALLAAEPREDGAVFSGGYGNAALPVVCVPTTAGTGSEVTPYAILTNDAARTKTSLFSPAIFPKLAYLDGGYTEGLPPAITRNTAMDAFSHAAESMLKQSSSPASELFARESLRMLYPILSSLKTPTAGERDSLLLAASLAGMAIAQTGTTVVHGMGYFLTYDYGIPHGRANGLLLGETLRLCEEQKVAALSEICAACGAGVTEICATLSALCGEREKLPKAKLEEYAIRTMGTKNVKKCKFELHPEDALRIFLHSFGLSS